MKEISIISAHNKIKFADKMALKNNETITEDNIYVLSKKLN